MRGEFRNSTFLIKRLYDQAMEPLTDQYQVTRMELDVLLFLANNPQLDTATDLVNQRSLTKSHVSSSVASLVKRGCLERVYQQDNRKVAHLKLLAPAEEIVEAGQRAQQHFFASILRNFTSEELAWMDRIFKKIESNARTALKEGRNA